MIYMKLGDPDQALIYAEAAAGHFPGWSKPHSRRAVALEALGRLEQAESAIYKAIEEVDNEIDCDPKALNVKTEYLQIQQGIQHQLALANTASFVSNEMALETANRHEHEKKRRSVISGPLRDANNKKLDAIVDAYCSEKLDDPTGAMRNLLESILPLLQESKGTLVWLEKMFNPAPVPDRKIMEEFCMQQGPPWLLRAMQYRGFSRLAQVVNSSLEERHEIKFIYQQDIDGDAMKAACWLTTTNEENRDFVEAKQMAVIFLNNLLVMKFQSERRKLQDLGRHSPLIQKLQKLTVLYNTCLPSRLWPCVKEMEYEWSYTARDIDAFWKANNPQIFRRWKAAFQELFQWLQGAEDDADMLLLFLQGVSFEESLRGRLALNVYMVGIFLLKKCLEYGGTAALKQSLNHQRDYSELVADCYSLLRLFKMMCPKIVEFIEAAKAQHGVPRR